MTTPSAASSAAVEAAGSTLSAESVIAPIPQPGGHVRSALRVLRRPRLLQTSLDVAAVVFIAMAFWTTSISAEFMFHCVFVVLVLNAFLFGLRGTLIRIGLVSLPLLIRADAADLGMVLPPLELTEWPLMFVIAVLVAWMADLRAATSRRYAGLFRLASERLLTVVEDERRRVGGELHDGVGQVLTALTLTLDAAAEEADVAGTHRRLERARRLADTALADTRDLSHRLRPARLEERGLVGAVADLAAESEFEIGLAIAADAHDPGLSATATIEVFRIIQEALANAARHSGVARAEVSIQREGGSLLVDVVDTGAGFDVAAVADSGIGLAGMEERARLLGGELAITTSPGAGTTVHLSVPLGEPAAAGVD
ncbi:MAG TPA: sensor histidine kinase [Candidatus Limnocylindria bacterium]|nr:sensor histidine kinase [Candidatus Limnocylindria bacterium]